MADLVKDYLITLDLIRENKKLPTIKIKETDLNSVRFIFQILDDGHIVDLSGAAVRLAVLKPSGLTVFQDCNVTFPETGECDTLLSAQAYNEVGTHTAELVISHGTMQTVTAGFTYESLDSIIDDTVIESSNDWQSFHEILLSADQRPILGEGPPNGFVTPEYIGQMYLDTNEMLLYFASDITAEGWKPFGIEKDPTVYWADVREKPLDYPPSVHTHSFTELSDVPMTFAPDSHTHPWGDIEGVPLEFAPTAHTHDFETGITNKPIDYPPSAHTHAWDEITDKPNEFTPATHSHPEHAASDHTHAEYALVDHTHTETDITVGGANLKTYIDSGDSEIKNTILAGLKLWKGTQAQYNAIGSKDANTLYFVVG